MGSGYKQKLMGWLTWIGMLLVIILVISLGEWLPPMRAIQRFLDSHPLVEQSLAGITLAMTVLGMLLLTLTAFLVRVPDASGAPDFQVTKTSGVTRGPGEIFSGTRAEASFSDETRMWRLKQAFRDGEWWRVPRWRRMSLMLLGGMLLFYGLLGLLFLLFPPGVKFLLFLATLYATIRTAYAFAADRPSRS